MPGAVELLRDQPPIPTENGVRFGNLRDILQSFAAESLRDLGQCGSLRVRQPEPGRQMGSEDAVLGRQVFVAQQQFLIDEAGHEGQQACPMESIAHGRTFIVDEPLPSNSRKYFDQTTTWKDFISAHMAVLAASDFFTVEVFTWRGLTTYYVLFFLNLESRRITLAGMTRHPT